MLAIRLPPETKAFIFGLLLASAASTACSSSKKTSMTGQRRPELAVFDHLMADFLRDNDVPGGALAIMKDGRLVYARGFGLADREEGRAVQPDTLFRIASLSKPFTAAAVLTLVEQGKLRFSDNLLDAAGVQPALAPGQEVDPRLRRVTVETLLRHTGGFDRDKSFDPMFRSGPIAEALGKTTPPSAADIVRYMLAQPLDFEPGERFAYSNFGYCALGRIVEHAGGTTYESFVRKQLLEPLGIRSMRLGRTRSDEKAPGEATYYGQEKGGPYGGFDLEVMDSHGGWLASTVDLLRFARILDYPLRDGVLEAATLRSMLAPTPGEAASPSYYALGWEVRPVADGKANVWHVGSLDGTSTLLVHRFDNLAWAVLFNKRRPDAPGSTEFAAMIDEPLHRAAATVTRWPEDDLFGLYSARPPAQ